MGDPRQDRSTERRTMKFIIKTLLLLAVLAGVGLVGYAYLAKLDPEQKEVTIPVQLDVD